MISNESNDYIQMVRIGGIETPEDKEKLIATKKLASRISARARNSAKRDTCYICGKKCSSFCNSHSIPQFTLRNIAEKGKVIATLQKEVITLGNDTGIGRAGTFQFICNECDNSVFQDYENPLAYNAEPTDKMLSQIALKNFLQMIYKRTYEHAFYEIVSRVFPSEEEFVHEKQFIGSHDLCDYTIGYNYAYSALCKARSNNYYLCYYRKLDYVVPFAAQSPIILISDFEDNVINDIYNFSPSYRQHSIHVAVFPLEKTSVVMMFIEEGQRRYRKFYRQLNKLPLDDQLAAINYIIFAYTENVYINKTVADKLQVNKSFVDTCRITTDVTSPVMFNDALPTAVRNFSLSNRNRIPNLLSREYEIHG